MCDVCDCRMGGKRDGRCQDATCGERRAVVVWARVGGWTGQVGVGAMGLGAVCGMWWRRVVDGGGW